MITTINATLFRSKVCTADGITARGVAPILGLCRRLIAAGYAPGSELECFRDGVLAVRIRTIGEGAALEVNGEADGFRPFRGPAPAPYVRSPVLVRPEVPPAPAPELGVPHG